MENTYDKLIKAAIEIMEFEGYSGTSIGKVASKVGISKSTVIHYFKSKEGMLLAILENFLPDQINLFKPILNDDSISGIVKLDKFIKCHMKMVAERRDVLSINLRDTKYLSGNNRVVYQQQQRVYEGQVVEIVKQIQKESSVFSGLNSVICAKAIIGMCNYACIWFREGGEYSIDDIAEQMFALLVGSKLR